MKHNWDKHSIKAEINRRNETLASLERRYRLKPATLKVALVRPFPMAEKMISKFLNVPISVLFAYRNDPSRKRRIPQQPKDTRVAPIRESQKRHVDFDMENVA